MSGALPPALQARSLLYPDGCLRALYLRGAEDARDGKTSISTLIHGQAQSGAYLQGFIDYGADAAGIDF